MGKSKEMFERLRESGCYAEDYLPSDSDRDYFEAANNRDYLEAANDYWKDTGIRWLKSVTI